jgi:peroxiredoxin
VDHFLYVAKCYRLAGTSADERYIRLSEFRGRRNLVVVFTGEGSSLRSHELLRALGGRYQEFQDENAEIVIIVAGPSNDAARVQRDDKLPFPVLADEQSTWHRALGAIDSPGRSSGAGCIADQYGEIYAALPCSDDKCPSADEILEWVRFIELQCPECGVSEWPRV